MDEPAQAKLMTVFMAGMALGAAAMWFWFATAAFLAEVDLPGMKIH